ncbi:MAG: type III pantothenate kinase [Oscillospiraceae bacterium]|nr:type III pantothenate kinase [Oscillospiraceae bacterium]
MLFVLDMGNTNIDLGVYDEARLLFGSQVATDRAKMADQYAIEFLDIIRLYRVPEDGFSGAIFSSVVPALDRRIRKAVEKVTGLVPLQVGPGIKTGVDIKLDNPAQLGADLLVGAVAAIARVGVPCMIWDLGTATKVSVLDKDGCFRGGAIMPGVQTAYDSLVAATSLLPHVSMEPPARVIGSETVPAMQSGAVLGTASMIDGMSDRIEAELGYPAAAVATGGLGREIIGCCKRRIEYDENLLLEGLWLLYEKNKKMYNV